MAELDANALYGNFQKTQDWKDDAAKASIVWRDDLGKKLAFKSLNIGDTPDPDEMHIEANKLITHNYFRDPKVTPPVANPVTKPSGMGTLGKLAIGAALLGTGAGAGIGIPLLLDAIRKPAEQVIKERILRGDADVIAQPAEVTPPKQSGAGE